MFPQNLLYAIMTTQKKVTLLFSENKNHSNTANFHCSMAVCNIMLNKCVVQNAVSLTCVPLKTHTHTFMIR